ncbi:hypothetical protein HNQ91_002156 [Filimonas zeae]|nr:hypothetical protein [Filimonas zeae]MDR6339105.1 hypothetical protein [Filimonas zeae]
MTKKVRLAFEMLESEMEKISGEELSGFKGGDGWGDCVFQSISFATGLSVSQIQQAYADHINTYGWSSQTAYNYVGIQGVSGSDVAWLMSQYGLSSGYYSTGGYNTSSSGDAGILLIDLDGNGTPDHAINVTGNANSTGYYTYDAQSSSGGTISMNDPRIVGSYGF